MHRLTITLSLLLFSIKSLIGAPTQPVEIGTVQWNRDLDVALKQAKQAAKPVFALFQEVPGCASCKQFGKTVLSHQLMVEAIESAFIPVAVFNNKAGKDAVWLKRYEEPAWNYQVIRFLDAQGEDLIPRKDRVWTLGGVARRMVQALKAAGETPPTYLESLAVSENLARLEETYFGMFCFWTGERRLGGLNGVVKTEAGFLEGREVTRVWFDPNQTSLSDLTKAAGKLQCADTLFVQDRKQQNNIEHPKLNIRYADPKGYRKAPKTDQKKQLQGTPFAQLDLTPYQATKINACVRTDPEKAASLLSPKQQASLKATLRETRAQNP